MLALATVLSLSAIGHAQQPDPYPEEFNITVYNPLTALFPIAICKAVGNLYKPNDVSPDSLYLLPQSSFWPTTDHTYAYAAALGILGSEQPYELLLTQMYEHEEGFEWIDTVAWGKYKILIATTYGEQDPSNGEYILEESIDSIYFDLSTTNYPWSYSGSEVDMYFQYLWDGEVDHRFQVRVDGPSWLDVPTGTTVAIWDQTYNSGAPSRVTSNFKPAAPFGFAIGAESTGQHHPRISWTADTFPLTYKIHRKIDNGSFQNIENVSNSTMGHYTDESLAGAGSGNHVGEYFVKVVNESYTSVATPTLSINWSYWGYEKIMPVTATQQAFLGPNYPNPFNPSTIIFYDVPKSGSVELIIFNILGQEVRRLVNEIKEAGRHYISWDGRDHADNSVSAGTYLYQLRFENFRQTRRMQFIK